MTMSYIRNTAVLRSLKHQLSCLSIRAAHQHIQKTPTCLESSALHRSLFLYHTPAKEAENKSLQSSLQKVSYSEVVNKYRCLGGLNINNIVDYVRPDLKYDCPKVSDLQIEIITPSVIRAVLPVDEPETNQIEKVSPGTSSIEKLAHSKGLIRIRKRKMKKHRRKKRMAILWPLFRKASFIKKSNREKKLAKQVARMRMYGEKYDALQEIKANLEHAKLKGYHFNIFGDKTQNFGFADELKEKK